MLIAYEDNGQQLGSSQEMARLVVSGDAHGALYVRAIGAIALTAAPEPGS